MDMISNVNRKARKEHKCDFCLQKIEKRDVYNAQTNVYEGEIYTWKSHLRCGKIASELRMYDDSGYEGLGSDDFIEYINNAYYDLIGNLNVPKTDFKERLDFICKKFLDESNNSGGQGV